MTPQQGRRGRLGGALAAVWLAAACGLPLAGAEGLDRPAPPPAATSIEVALFLDTLSDQPQEADHLATFEEVVVPEAAARGATVVALVVGEDGFTAPRKLAEVSFSDIADRAEGNPQMQESLTLTRINELVFSVRDGLSALPPSPLSDPFGGAAAAASVLNQYPLTIPRSLIVFGDQMANQPEGCVMSARDLTRIDALLQVCTGGHSVVLTDVAVSIVGAGYNLDGSIPTSTAQNLERLLRRFYEQAGAEVVRYGQVFARTATGR